MKILLLGDASNYHHSLSVGLARQGHEVTVASNGSRWMDTSRDIDLSRGKGKLGGALLWAKLNTVLASRLKGYDVVQIHNPVFLDLRPSRVSRVFDKLRLDNGGVFLTALGTDPQYIRMCTGGDCPLRYSEYRVGNAPTPFAAIKQTHINEWLTDEMVRHSEYIYEHIDGAVSALYEYHLSCLRHLPSEMLAYGGIPIDTGSIAYNPLSEDVDHINVMLACHKGREPEKGADLLLPLLRGLEADNPGRMKLDLVQNVPFAQFQQSLSEAHIVVDQLYSYTPATTALITMASGKVTVSGGEPEYYEFIGEHTLKPIINADPQNLDALVADMQRIIDNPAALHTLSTQGRDFIMKHNEVDVVAKRFTDFWERRIR